MVSDFEKSCLMKENDHKHSSDLAKICLEFYIGIFIEAPFLNRPFIRRNRHDFLLVTDERYWVQPKPPRMTTAQFWFKILTSFPLPCPNPTKFSPARL
jgi:hypothetical protein